MIWYVLLLLVSVGLVIAGCIVEDSHGFYAAVSLALPGFAGCLWAFYLFVIHTWLLPFMN